jgi:hypothetical protein
MRLPVSTRYALGAAALIASLAGCSGGSQLSAVNTPSQTAPQQRSVSGYHPMISSDGVWSVLPAGFTPNRERPSWMKSPPPNVATGHVAVAQFGGSSVLWFLRNDRRNKPPTVCEPASSTNGIAIDRSKNLWVPDGRANTTTEYGPNCGAAKLTIPDPTGEPADVGFDSKGHIYILNLNNHTGPPTVEVYDSSGTQTGTLSDPSFAVLFGIGTDSNDNIFVSNLTSSNVGNIIEFPGGAMPGTALTGVSLGLPGSPVFDSSNNLIISDWFRGTIDFFAPPYKSAPKTVPLKGQSIWCPLGPTEKRIFCGDAQNGSIDVYAYPTGTYLYSYSNGLSASALVTGVAPSPAAPL